MPNTTSQKLRSLKIILNELDSCVLAFSGGVDSTLLLKMARDVLGDNVLAITATSETFSKDELTFAKKYAKGLGVRHRVIKTHEIKDKNFFSNTKKRCFYCKRTLFLRLKDISKKEHINFVIDAANATDKKDFRPGLQAAEIMGVRSPFVEAGMNKKDIYMLSRRFNLPTKNKPSFACLASRFPYGEKITRKKLFIVGSLESFLRSLGTYQVRVRHHGPTARIEVADKDFDRVFHKRSLVVKKAKSLGYKYVSLDLEGYRTGSLNEVLK